MSSIEFVSLPGPSDKGGVGPTINWIINNIAREAGWTYFSASDMQWQSIRSNVPLGTCDRLLVEAHRRHAQGFIYPLLIGQPQFAQYNQSDAMAYDRFNRQLEQYVSGTQSFLCIQDHELAIPGHTRIWHGPIPGYVPAFYAPHFTSFIENSIRVKNMVFHTDAFLDNLIQYVTTYLGDKYQIDRVSHPKALIRSSNGERINLHAFPLGIDAQHWIAATKNGKRPQAINLERKKVISLVARCDPAKAWEAALESILRFLHSYPNPDEILVTVQCGHVHEGLPLYDELWNTVQDYQNRLVGAFPNSVIFIDQHLPHEELAWIYRHTNVMLVIPWADGQPLTPKEYVICQNQHNPGVVILSAGAGVWSEFRGYVLEGDPRNPTGVAQAIDEAIRLSTESHLETRLGWHKPLRRRIIDNTLGRWWANVAAATGMAA